MRHSGSPGIRAVDVWDVLRNAISTDLSIGEVVKRLFPLNFYDEFNRTAEDTDIWTSGGDGGSFTRVLAASRATHWELTTGGVIDNDWYIHGDALIGNKAFSNVEVGYTTVTFETRVRVPTLATSSVFIGLIETIITGYSEPATDCAHFLMDAGITNTFRARTYRAAEEETDTLVPFDTLWHVYKIVWTTTSVLFYIDDVLVATHATQVPIDTSVVEVLIRTEAGAARTLQIDYVHVEVS